MLMLVCIWFGLYCVLSSFFDHYIIVWQLYSLKAVLYSKFSCPQAAVERGSSVGAVNPPGTEGSGFYGLSHSSFSSAAFLGVSMYLGTPFQL